MHLLNGIGVSEALHGAFVKHLLEPLTDVATHTLRGRERVGKFGVRLFKVLQFVHLEVELHIADGRLIEHIVVIVVAIQFVAQLLDFCFNVGHRKIYSNVAVAKSTIVPTHCKHAQGMSLRSWRYRS